MQTMHAIKKTRKFIVGFYVIAPFISDRMDYLLYVRIQEGAMYGTGRHQRLRESRSFFASPSDRQLYNASIQQHQPRTADIRRNTADTLNLRQYS